MEHGAEFDVVISKAAGNYFSCLGKPKAAHYAERKMALAPSHYWPLFYGTDEYLGIPSALPHINSRPAD